MYDKVLIQIAVAGTSLFVCLMFFIVLIVVNYKNREKKYSLERQKLLFELDKKELRMSFEERELVLNEVSREVHDNIGQVAHILRMSLYNVAERSTDPKQQEEIKYVSELAMRIVEETRSIGHSLNNSFIKDRGLYRMLEHDVEHIRTANRKDCFIDVRGKAPSLSAESELLIYRIAQEAMHNCLKHSGASLIEIVLDFQQEHFIMSISDDGVGFDESAIGEKGMMGLVNMRQRAGLLNGELHIESSPGKGCIVRLIC